MLIKYNNLKTLAKGHSLKVSISTYSVIDDMVVKIIQTACDRAKQVNSTMLKPEHFTLVEIPIEVKSKVTRRKKSA